MRPAELAPSTAAEVALIVNVRSRSGARAADLTRLELQRLGVQVKLYVKPASGPDLIAAVRQAIASGLHTIVIGGGMGRCPTWWTSSPTSRSSLLACSR